MNYQSSTLYQQVLPRYFDALKQVQSSEANYAALLYATLLRAGLSHTQVCTEMYSANLIKDGVRPDLVIFDEGINGRFNYFQDCNRNKSNTDLKKQHLRAVVEIKGGAQQHESGLGKYHPQDPLGLTLLSEPEKRRKNQQCALALDIEKLAIWASHFGHQAGKRDYIFLAIDIRNPKGFWPDHIRDMFGRYAVKHQVTLVYYAQGQDHYWCYQNNPTGTRIPLIDNEHY